MSIYPIPPAPGTTITVENTFKANHYTLQDMTGRQVENGGINSTQQVVLPQLRPGIYMPTISNCAGTKAVRKLVIGN